MPHHILITAALPALLGSLLLLHVAAVPGMLLIQQAIVTIVAILGVLLAARFARANSAVARTPWWLLGMAALLWAPLIGADASGPQRWIGASGVRVHVAPVVLPLFLLCGYRAMSGTAMAVRISSVAAIATMLALLVQPDAAQLTAFAIASVAVLGGSANDRWLRLLTLSAIIVAAAVAWTLPDPLAPVAYVEGVFTVAAGHSHWALFMAIVAAALPVIALGALAARMKSPGILAVALYFAVLYLLAPLQVTPVPLLGFGAGPVLGYFILTSQVRSVHNELA